MHTISRRRRLAAILLLPFMLLLAGCGRIVGEFEVRDVDTLYVSLDYAIDTSVIEELNTYGSDMGETPEEFCGLTEEQAGDWGEVTPEAYEEDGMWGCRIEGMVDREDFGTGIELTEEDGEYHFVLSGTDTGSGTTTPGFDDFEFSFTISFPGQVIESANGTIDGNSVVFTDINEFGEGVDIRAEAGGFPWIIVIIAVVVIGFFLLLIVAAAAFFLLRSRNRKPSGGPGSGMTSGAPAAPAAPAAFGASAGSPGFGQSPPAAPQPSAPAAPPQGSPAPPQQSAPSQGQPWGQPSPAAPQQPSSEPQWGQQPQGPEQPQAPQQQPPQAPPQNDPWAQPGQDPQHGQQWNQQPPPPQNPGW